MTKDFAPLFKTLPPTVQKLIRRVADSLNPEKIFLFGSRARGTQRDNSDFDFAIVGVKDFDSWTQLQVDVSDEAISLYPIDLVLFESVSEDYKQNIKTEGRVIYG